MQNGGGRTLVAGIGNIFLGDDGFGSEVASRIDRSTLPGSVEVLDAGISGVHLAYQLLDGYDRLVLIDALPLGEPPGTVAVFRPDLDDVDEGPVDAHGLDPASVLRMVRQLGGTPGDVLVVGCEPATLDEGMGLSAAVAGAVDEAVRVVTDLVTGEE